MSTGSTDQQYNFSIGLGLAILSTIFIGSSFIIKKKALIKINNKGRLRAAAGGFSYLKEWMWWAGFLSLGVGEVANFAAYAFAPASLVTPLGALSILISAVLASKCLHERLNILGKLGCILCIVGSTIIVIHSPKKDKVESLDVLRENLKDTAFVLYVLVVIFLFCSIIFYFGPRYGHQNVLVYILVCSAVGSLTVMACKGLGLAIKAKMVGNESETNNWLTLFFVASVIVCVLIQMNYLNKALDLFNTGVVIPVYYVIFTMLVIIASTILYSEWETLNENDIIGNVCGFSTVVIGVFLLNGFKDIDISFSDIQVPFRNRPKDCSVILGSLKKLRNDDERIIIDSDVNSYGTRSNYKL